MNIIPVKRNRDVYNDHSGLIRRVEVTQNLFADDRFHSECRMYDMDVKTAAIIRHGCVRRATVTERDLGVELTQQVE